MAIRVYPIKSFIGWEPAPPAGKIRGGALATQVSRDKALQTQGLVVGQGRRVLAAVGLQGQQAFFVQDGLDPEGTASQEYPAEDSYRVMTRTISSVTPGYRLRVYGIFAPSGPTQYYTAEPGVWLEDTGSAYLTVKVTLDNGIETASQTKSLVPPWSLIPYKALATGTGGAFGDLWEAGTWFNPGNILDAVGWTEGITASIVVTAYGGVRPIDVVVYEEPYKAVHDEDHKECTVSGFTPYGQLSGIEWAITAIDLPDTAIKGSIQASKTIRDQRTVWGPRLVDWTCWSEVGPAITADEGDPVTVTGTGWQELRGDSITAWDADNPGWSLSSGGSARSIEQNGLIELRTKNAAVPVLIRFSAKVSGGGAVGTLRFQSEDYSLREFSVTDTDYAWHQGIVWLRCGVHQTARSVLQVLGKTGGITQTMSVRYLSVEYLTAEVSD